MNRIHPLKMEILVGKRGLEWLRYSLAQDLEAQEGLLWLRFTRHVVTPEGLFDCYCGSDCNTEVWCELMAAFILLTPVLWSRLQHLPDSRLAHIYNCAEWTIRLRRLLAQCASEALVLEAWVRAAEEVQADRQCQDCKAELRFPFHNCPYCLNVLCTDCWMAHYNRES